ncbi:hypothetical protein [Nocardioides albidus]
MEYALLTALIAAVIVSAVLLLGGRVGGLFDNTNASVNSAITP